MQTKHKIIMDLKKELPPMTTFLFKTKSEGILKIYLYSLKLILDGNIRVYNLPSLKYKITLLKSPFVYKKAKVHYEKETHKAVLRMDTKNNLSLIIKLILFNKPKTVSVKIHHDT